MKFASNFVLNLLTINSEYSAEQIEKKVVKTGLNMKKDDYEKIFKELTELQYLELVENKYKRIK